MVLTILKTCQCAPTWYLPVEIPCCALAVPVSTVQGFRIKFKGHCMWLNHDALAVTVTLPVTCPSQCTQPDQAASGSGGGTAVDNGVTATVTLTLPHWHVSLSLRLEA